MSVVLGRPTDRSITLNLLTPAALEVLVEYGTAERALSHKITAVSLAANQPREIVVEGLQPNSGYFYRLSSRRPGDPKYAEGPEGSFHTQRPPGASFTFVLQADPHLDDGTDPEVYKRSLRDELVSSADFPIDLGDTFMSDKLEPLTRSEVINRHLLARSYYEMVTASLPLFLVLGNHEGENSRRLDGTAENLAVWASISSGEVTIRMARGDLQINAPAGPCGFTTCWCATTSRRSFTGTITCTPIRNSTGWSIRKSRSQATEPRAIAVANMPILTATSSPAPAISAFAFPRWREERIHAHGCRRTSDWPTATPPFTAKEMTAHPIPRRLAPKSLRRRARTRTGLRAKAAGSGL